MVLTCKTICPVTQRIFFFVASQLQVMGFVFTLFCYFVSSLWQLTLYSFHRVDSSLFESNLYHNSLQAPKRCPRPLVLLWAFAQQTRPLGVCSHFTPPLLLLSDSLSFPCLSHIFLLIFSSLFSQYFQFFISFWKMIHSYTHQLPLSLSLLNLSHSLLITFMLPFTVTRSWPASHWRTVPDPQSSTSLHENLSSLSAVLAVASAPLLWKKKKWTSVTLLCY